MNEPDHFVTVFYFARHFKIHAKTVRRMIQRGELRASRVGRQWRIPKTDYCQRCAGNNGCAVCPWRK